MKLKIGFHLCLITILASLAPAAHAQTFSVIHPFTGVGGDGANPQAGVTLRGGTLYGTTSRGGVGGLNGPGTIYQMTHVGSDWRFSPIFLFPGDRSGGVLPEARVVFGTDGHLYGTATSGGPNNGGVVFDVVPPLSICKTAACFWTENVLHSFSGNPDGVSPSWGDLVWDQQGNIYGTTTGGGHYNFGTVYEMTKLGNVWTEMPIHDFPGPDGESPLNGVVFNFGSINNGNLYGTTSGGGGYGYGSVFSLTPFGGDWFENKIYAFPNGDGPNSAGLVIDDSGILYGATRYGGSGGGGTIFELSPYDNWVFHPLYSFTGDPDCGPWASLTMDSAGNLYGTTYCHGANHYGNIFKLTSTSNGWVYTSLHDFTGGSDGAYPDSTATIDTDGTLYGTASQGGSNNYGLVWMIKP